MQQLTERDEQQEWSLDNEDSRGFYGIHLHSLNGLTLWPLFDGSMMFSGTLARRSRCLICGSCISNSSDLPNDNGRRGSISIESVAVALPENYLVIWCWFYGVQPGAAE